MDVCIAKMTMIPIVGSKQVNWTLSNTGLKSSLGGRGQEPWTRRKRRRDSSGECNLFARMEKWAVKPLMEPVVDLICSSSSDETSPSRVVLASPKDSGVDVNSPCHHREDMMTSASSPLTSVLPDSRSEVDRKRTEKRWKTRPSLDETKAMRSSGCDNRSHMRRKTIDSQDVRRSNKHSISTKSHEDEQATFKKYKLISSYSDVSPLVIRLKACPSKSPTIKSKDSKSDCLKSKKSKIDVNVASNVPIGDKQTTDRLKDDFCFGKDDTNKSYKSSPSSLNCITKDSSTMVTSAKRFFKSRGRRPSSIFQSRESSVVTSGKSVNGFRSCLTSIDEQNDASSLVTSEDEPIGTCDKSHLNQSTDVSSSSSSIANLDPPRKRRKFSKRRFSKRHFKKILTSMTAVKDATEVKGVTSVKGATEVKGVTEVKDVKEDSRKDAARCKSQTDIINPSIVVQLLRETKLKDEILCLTTETTQELLSSSDENKRTEKKSLYDFDEDEDEDVNGSAGKSNCTVVATSSTTEKEEFPASDNLETEKMKNVGFLSEFAKFLKKEPEQESFLFPPPFPHSSFTLTTQQNPASYQVTRRRSRIFRRSTLVPQLHRLDSLPKRVVYKTRDQQMEQSNPVEPVVETKEEENVNDMELTSLTPSLISTFDSYMESFIDLMNVKNGENVGMDFDDLVLLADVETMLEGDDDDARCSHQLIPMSSSMSGEVSFTSDQQQLVKLRHSVLCLLKALVPQLDLPSRFDTGGHAVDELVEVVCEELDESRESIEMQIAFGASDNSCSNAVVEMCRSPGECLIHLKSRVTVMLNLLLPHLGLNSDKSDQGDIIGTLLDEVILANLETDFTTKEEEEEEETEKPTRHPSKSMTTTSQLKQTTEDSFGDIPELLVESERKILADDQEEEFLEPPKLTAVDD